VRCWQGCAKAAVVCGAQLLLRLQECLLGGRLRLHLLARVSREAHEGAAAAAEAGSVQLLLGDWDAANSDAVGTGRSCCCVPRTALSDMGGLDDGRMLLPQLLLLNVLTLLCRLDMYVNTWSAGYYHRLIGLWPMGTRAGHSEALTLVYLRLHCCSSRHHDLALLLLILPRCSL
jgi:hypothetical protein